MAKEQEKSVRLSKAIRDFGIGIETAVAFLRARGEVVEEDPNTKISQGAYQLLSKEYGGSHKQTEQKQQQDKQRKKPQTVGDALGMQVDSAAQQSAHREENPVELTKASVRLAVPQPKVLGRIDVEGKSSVKDASSAGEVAKGTEPTEVKAVQADAKKREVPKAIEKKADSKIGEVGEPAKVQPVFPSAARKEVEKPAETTKAEVKTEKKREVSSAAAEVKKAVVGESLAGSPVSGAARKSGEQAAQPKAGAAEQKRQEEQVLDPVSEHRLSGPMLVGKLQLDSKGRPVTPKREESKAQETDRSDAGPVVSAGESHAQQPAMVPPSAEEEDDVFRPNVAKLEGPKVLGKIELPLPVGRSKRKPEASATPGGAVQKRRRRKRIGADGLTSQQPGQKQQVGQQAQPKSKQQNSTVSQRPPRKSRTQRAAEDRQEISMQDVEEKIKQTRARIASKKSSTLAKGAKMRREHRSILEAKREQEQMRAEQQQKTLSVSEFVTANELAGLMNVSVTDVIEACMNMGQLVSINQRLDAETLTLVADEFGFELEFVEAKIDIASDEPEDKPEDLEPRPPIFVVLGHVDHGKTTLCDTIRRSNVTEKEAGGITQHLTAYSIAVGNRRATLIDTPGHEAFTAMRARGAGLTDVAIIVVSAEDGLMPQTLEAMAQASLQNVRIVFAINKIDSPKADPERVKEELSQHNYLVEDWGGKYQCQEISAKFNKNVDLLLEKVLLEADIIDLKANPKRRAEALVLESTVDKGRGNVVWVLVQNGTLRRGDSVVAGGYYGRVKAMFNDRGKAVASVGPSTPVQVIGLNGAPQAGDIFRAVKNDKEARDIASKVTNIRRVQEMRSRKHITLDEIGRRIAIGNFQELNLIVKGDVDGSVEALSDSLIKLSTEEIQVNVLLKGVGQITESDVTMAMTSNSVIVGFQVRPSTQAKKLADAEQIDIRLYSVIYDAIEEIKSAMEGMLSPEVKEEVVGTVEVLETYRISKVGTIAGCIVREGKIGRGNKVRIIRDGIVVYSSELSSLKRYKDEAKEVLTGMECGVGIKNYNDIKVGDIVEAFVEVEVKRTL